MNLDYMRTHRPGAPQTKATNEVLPDPGYEDPVPDGDGSLGLY